MANTLQELRDYISASGFESPVKANATTIATYVESNIINHPNSLFKHRVPPLDIILYALRRLLAPGGDDAAAPRLCDIPDLLDFVTTIEFYRNLALQKAREALELHAHYQANEPARTALTAEDVARLREHGENDVPLRGVYFEMVLQYCQIDIYRLWTSDPSRPADVTLHLCEYFPALNPHYRNAGEQSPRLFHYDLSETEREELRLRGLDACLFVTDSCEWAVKRRKDGQTLASVFQTSEFSAQFPCRLRFEDLRETMDYYMNTVAAMVNELQDMFPEDDEASTTQ
ncbi:hypothetical protein GGX14DRAFT_677959 [Mycena pura]|uniref:Uncharacterized protein n=1 Tax=Mycena pura TaxID=153505 RepID=A0AAD6UUS1_9AGAR|nr:hypothetical protein GGX14DRAFT_677959 [Mycena pura]